MSSQSIQIIGPGKDTGGRTPVEVCEPTKALVVADSGGVSNLVQQGAAFHVGLTKENLTNNSSMWLGFTTGAEEVHLRVTGSCGNVGRLTLYEGGTLNVGTPLTALNKNRSSLTTTLTVWQNEGSIGPISNGSIIATYLVDRGRRVERDWILKANTVYVFRFRNRSGVTADYEITVDYTEPGLV